jgi:hypothetical protein
LLRRAIPMWSDSALPRLAAEVSSGAVLAAGTILLVLTGRLSLTGRRRV